ncbi:MAG TPA: TrmH family RNA methyltransferase [Anaerolineales bacterium]|nr:TrmH family RNA methyltransferase [Anaerolineales bacterium]
MPNTAYAIRLCETCGLRYPLMDAHPFGTRCPACMGETRTVLRRELGEEKEVNPRLEEWKSKRKVERGKRIAVLLDNIRSGWNVGSILRSADGFGFTHAFLCGITPTGDNEAVTKTSLGAEVSVPWSYHKDAVKLVKGLKHESWKVYGLEEAGRAIPLTAAHDLPTGAWERAVLIMGNEVTGVDPELLELCDEVFHIQMRGEKRSFNVAIAFGIAAYALTRQKQET